MAAGSRDRVTVDLRGAGSVVQAKAMAQGLTVAAFVRRAVMTIAEAPVAPTDALSVASRDAEQPLIKVTLRLPAASLVARDAGEIRRGLPRKLRGRAARGRATAARNVGPAGSHRRTGQVDGPAGRDEFRSADGPATDQDGSASAGGTVSQEGADASGGRPRTP